MDRMLALTPWVETLRDTSAVIVALAGAVIAVSTAAKLPIISRPVHWVGRTLFASPMERWLTRFLNEHQAPIHETINATAAKVDATAAKVDEVDERLQIIEHEVMPNDGSSLRDSVTRNEALCARVERELLTLISNAPLPQANLGQR